jgi:hypothetical protein
MALELPGVAENILMHRDGTDITMRTRHAGHADNHTVRQQIHETNHFSFYQRSPMGSAARQRHVGHWPSDAWRSSPGCSSGAERGMLTTAAIALSVVVTRLSQKLADTGTP